VLTEVMDHFGLACDPNAAGFYETPHHRRVLHGLRAALPRGRLIVVAGLVGSGKTAFVRRFCAELAREGQITVSRSLSVDKGRLNLANLITALFYDLSPGGREPKVPSQGEKRERALQALVRQGRKPVALFVDDAHDLHHKTLVGLKRLIEVVADGDGSLAIVLAGHPKLSHDLRRPTMEEIGYRTSTFAYDGVAGHQRAYLDWLLRACAAADT
jgi:type II secretory pathway predicted ATPase ExeA